MCYDSIHKVKANQKLWEHRAKQMLRRTDDVSHENAGLFDAEHLFGLNSNINITNDNEVKLRT